MNKPFTTAEFHGVFSAYNAAIWPMQLPVMALGVLAVVLLLRQRRYSSVGISAILTILWAWQALTYHLAFFTAINPLAYGFAALFVGGAAVFCWQGVVRRKLIFKPSSGWRMRAGWGLLTFAWFIYPVWTYLAGHRYPAVPTFGLPLWCFVDSQAAFLLDVPQELGLVVAGAMGIVLLVRSKGTAPRLGDIA